MKFLRQILLITWGTLAAGMAWGQGWERIYENIGPNDILNGIIQTEDDGFILAGAKWNGNNPTIVIIKTDLEGDTLWTKHFQTNEWTTCNDIIKSNSDDFILVGGTYFISTYGILIIAKVDSQGQEIWTKTINSYTGLSGQFVVETDDGNILVSGVKVNQQSPNHQNNYLAKLNQEGDLVWETLMVDSLNNYRLFGMEKLMDGSILLHGWVSLTGDETNKKLFLYNISENGDTNWIQQHSLIGDPLFHDLKQVSDGGFVSINYGPTIAKFDLFGNLEYEIPLTGVSTNFPTTSLGDFNIGSANNNEIVFTGFIGLSSNIYLAKIDFLGNIIWQHEIGNALSLDDSQKIIPTSDNGFAIVGAKTNYSVDDKEAYLIRTDSFGNSLTNYLQGNVFYDSLENCLPNPNEIPLTNWILTVEGENGTYHGITDEIGNYEIRTDTGSYTLHLTTPNAYWDACWADSLVTMPNFFDTLTVDFPVQAEYDCPILNVDISTPFLRRCYDNTYYISYCNEGTILAEDARIEVNFDDDLIIDGSSLPWTNQLGTTYTFEIGTVEVGQCGGFQVFVTVDCDNAELGETHCVEAHIYPDSICLPPNTLWDGSTIVVDGRCENDSLKFNIRNIGDDMTQPAAFIVIEDHILHQNGTFQLVTGDSLDIDFEATGATYRLEAEQAEGHPTNTAPSVTIEGCSDGTQSISWGFVNAYSENDADPFVSRDCQENIGSFDPNDKRGFPSGIGEDHIIFHDTELEYHIRFQNTGTDTAFRVVIRDTLSSFLDLTTLRPGASSHPYTWELQNGRALKFTFDDIMLPDSNVNEAASHGFVKFKIGQQLDNLPGTVIQNQAGIYFDFNAPIITNMAMHKIEDRPLLSDTLTLYFCDSELYEQDTTVLDFSSQLSWDVTTTNLIMVNASSQTELDTAILIGDLFQGMEYGMDTTLVQQYTSANGCDSTVTVHLEVMPSASNNLNSVIEKVYLFPNPSSNQVNLAIEMKETVALEITILNNLGQDLGDIAHQSVTNTGAQLIPIPILDLPNGIYWIKVASGSNIRMLKLVKQ